MAKQNTFKRYMTIYPGHSIRWANITLHIVVALLFICGILLGVHRLLNGQTVTGIVEIVIFGILLLSTLLVYPALVWAVYTIGNILVGIGRGFTEGVMDAYHVVKGDLLIENPGEDHFLKKLDRIEKPGEPRKETVREVPYEAPVEVHGKTVYVKDEVEKIVEVERRWPECENKEEKIRCGIQLYLWKTLHEFLLPSELDILYESIVAVRENDNSRIKPVTSASELRMVNSNERLSKNDLYSLADHLCHMMKIEAKYSYNVFAQLFPNIYGKMNETTFTHAMPKDNRYDKDGKLIPNKIVVHLDKRTRDNIDTYMLDLFNNKDKKEES